MAIWDINVPVERARMFVGGEPLSGEIQLDILKKEGLKPKHWFLEIGSGAGHLAMQVVPYLQKGHYFGIEPNQWTMHENFNFFPDFEKMLQDNEATFDANDQFNADVFGKHKLYDFIFSHSILSHASLEQLDQYFNMLSLHLREGGKAFASYREAETTDAPTWVYPGVTWFCKEDIEKVAEKYSLKVIYRPDIREYYMSRREEDEHDWLEIRG